MFSICLKFGLKVKKRPNRVRLLIPGSDAQKVTKKTGYTGPFV